MLWTLAKITTAYVSRRESGKLSLKLFVSPPPLELHVYEKFKSFTVSTHDVRDGTEEVVYWWAVQGCNRRSLTEEVFLVWKYLEH